MGSAADLLPARRSDHLVLQTWVYHVPSLSVSFLIVGDYGVAGLASPPPLRAGERAVPLRVGVEAKIPGLTDGRQPPPPPAAAAL